MSAIVLGVGPGLGLALAKAYAGTGRSVAIVGRRQEAMDAFAADVPGAVGLAADLADPEQVRTVIQHAADHLGPPDIVHYNASVMAPGMPTQVSLADVETAWRVGCLGAWAALQSAVPLMDEGSAFFVTSGGSAIHPWAQASVLSSAKAALRSLVFTAAEELPHLRVAMITVMGLIQPDTDLSPDEIARNFLALLEQRQPSVETMLPRA